MEACGLSFNASDVSTPTEPVIFLTDVWVYPVMTVWAMDISASSIITSRMFRPSSTDISCVSIPINEKTRTVSRTGAFMVYSPSGPDIAPVIVPLIRTFTPARGSPAASETCPLILLPCPKIRPGISNAANNMTRFFISEVSDYVRQFDPTLNLKIKFLQYASVVKKFIYLHHEHKIEN